MASVAEAPPAAAVVREGVPAKILRVAGKAPVHLVLVVVGLLWLVPTFGRQLQRLAEVKDDEARFKRGSAYIQEKQKMLQTARELGVKVALGYDPARAETHGTNAREIIALTTAGFTNLEAIRAATTSGAELLGWQDRVGSLEAGKFADIVAVPGNPLSDIKQLEHVSFVMKGGIVVKDERKVIR